MHGERSSKSCTSGDVLLCLYLIIGAAGTATLIAVHSGLADSLYHSIFLLLPAALVFSSLAWIPAIIVIVVFRRSWLIVVPAVTVIASSISLFFADDITGAPVVWLAAFFPVAFACGLVWAITRITGTGS